MNGLDALILSNLSGRWQKVARVIGAIDKQLEGAEIKPALESIGARIQALANAGLIEGQGNLSLWRYGEVRLPAATTLG